MAKLNSEKNDGGNFFSRIFSSIFGSNDPEAEKKRLLKSIAKDLSKTKYKFYKFSTEEALPSLGKAFYDIYKAIGPTQIMFQSLQNPNALKNFTINYSLNKKQLEILDSIDEANIIELAKIKPLNEVVEIIRGNLNNFSAEFDIEKINNIDSLYSKLMTFKNFCTFDYFFLLKKFNSSLPEREFNLSPSFDTIRSEYIIDDLKDFISVAWALPLNENWKDVLTLLKQMRGVEPITLGNWNKLINRLKDLRNNRIFEMIIQLSSKNPDYQPNISLVNERICEQYLDKLRTDAQNTLNKIEKDKTNSKIDQILNYLFGTTSIFRLKNYTETQNPIYEKKNLSGFLFSPPLNYMKAFLLDFFKKDVREFADLVLVRGKWTTATMANQFSEVYHNILAISDAITEFDNSLGEDQELGMKLKTLLLRCDKDRDTGKIMHSVLKDTNDRALELLTSCSQNLVSFGRSLKNLLEDHEKAHAEMIINWKELDRHTDIPIKDAGVKIYKMIFQFITLMQFYLKKNENSEA